MNGHEHARDGAVVGGHMHGNAMQSHWLGPKHEVHLPQREAGTGTRHTNTAKHTPG